MCNDFAAAEDDFKTCHSGTEVITVLIFFDGTDFDFSVFPLDESGNVDFFIGNDFTVGDKETDVAAVFMIERFAPRTVRCGVDGDEHIFAELALIEEKLSDFHAFCFDFHGGIIGHGLAVIFVTGGGKKFERFVIQVNADGIYFHQSRFFGIDESVLN